MFPAVSVGQGYRWGRHDAKTFFISDYVVVSFLSPKCQEKLMKVANFNVIRNQLRINIKKANACDVLFLMLMSIFFKFNINHFELPKGP